MRILRQILASLIFLVVLVCMCDLAGFLPHGFNIEFIADIQFVPAVLSVSILTVVIIVVATLLLGRVYCSVLCPLGVMQDLIIRLGTRRSVERRKIMFAPAKNTLRYSILVLSVLFLVFGSSYILLLLDPYSIFGRISTVILSPIISLINNGLFSLSGSPDDGVLGLRLVQVFPWQLTVVTLLSFVLIIYLSVMHSRLWCNALCPVGTLLGLLSRWSWFKVRVDQSRCVSCNECARVCKANSIDQDNLYSIDYTRCVTCFNCIDACDAKAIRYTKRK